MEGKTRPSEGRKLNLSGNPVKRGPICSEKKGALEKPVFYGLFLLVRDNFPDNFPWVNLFVSSATILLSRTRRVAATRSLVSERVCMTNANDSIPERGRALVDVRAVAARLSCSVRSVWRLADAGRLPAPVRLGRLIRWDAAVIDEWIASGCPSCRRV